MQNHIRMGVDIGGTFTDVVLEVGQDQFSTKVLTTYAAPENAIVDGMHQVCAKAGIAPDAIDQIIHGTTLATNALIERRGALNPGDTVAGPALITEDETTIVLPNSRTAIARPDGTIDITEKRT